jgi:RimJ/RimL family protein N-acetyltransferase
MIYSSEIITLDRFYLRQLTTADATDKYLSWFEDKVTAEFIQYARIKPSRKELQLYIKSKMESGDALFFGIFYLKDDSHIGNIKFEPIDFIDMSAEMGILIGDRSWRGQGVASEVILGAGAWLNTRLQIEVMKLGVLRHNVMAVKAYEKIGFAVDIQKHEWSDQALRMSLPLKKII